MTLSSQATNDDFFSLNKENNASITPTDNNNNPLSNTNNPDIDDQEIANNANLSKKASHRFDIPSNNGIPDPADKNSDFDEDSLNDFPSSNEYIDESRNEWKMPVYNDFPNNVEISNQLPPLLEEINFKNSQSIQNGKNIKRRSIRKDMQTVNQKKPLSPSKFVIQNNLKRSKSEFIPNENIKNVQNENDNHIQEDNLLHDIDSENDKYDSYYSYYEYDDYSDASNNAVINLPPPLEIGMEMPSVPELDIFDLFTFQLPYMPNASESDEKYMKEIDSHFNPEKLLQEIKSH